MMHNRDGERFLADIYEHLEEVEITYVTASRGLWKQQDGQLLAIALMKMDHLARCCSIIKKDMKRMELRPEDIKNKYFPLMQSKYDEIKSEIFKRVNKL